MIITYPSGTRVNWYDRNISRRARDYAGTALAPHALTLRLNYTPDTGKRGIVHAVALKVHRVTAAGTSGLFRLRATFDLNSVTANAFEIQRLDNTVNFVDELIIYPNVILFPGDTVLIYTEDLSVGGTITYKASLIANDYDP